MEQQILFSDDEETIVEEKNELEEDEDEYWDEETRIKFMKASCEIKEDIYEVYGIKKKKKKKKKEKKDNSKIYIPFGNNINIDDYKTGEKKWKSKNLESKRKKKEYKFNPKLPPWDFK